MAFDIKKYTESGFKHKLHGDTVKMYAELKVHLDGEYPRELIEERRPSEPLHVKDYRKLIFQHIGKPTINKVITSLNRIRKSKDYAINFAADSQPAVILKGETLQDYFDKGFPFFTSITNWSFTVLLKQMGVDANALCVVMPSDKSWEFAAGQYIKPYPFIFNSDKIIDYVQDEYAVIKSTDTSTFRMGEYTYHNGEVYYYIDRDVTQRWEKKDDGKFRLMGEFINGYGKLPAWKIGGVVKKTQDADFLLESRLAPMLPYLNEAVREYSDLQAGVVTHLFLEGWEITSVQCPACKGVGKVDTKEGTIKCKNAKCKDGFLMPSPYETTKVKPGKVGDNPVPVPPKGIVAKDVEIIKVQDTRIQNHKYEALASVNMEFLAKVQLAQSGIAKEVDRDETNNYVQSWHEDMVRNQDNIAFHTTEQRYRTVVPNPEKRREMLPVIPVCEKFDVISSSILVDNIGKMRTNKVNPLLINEAEKAFASKEFNAEPEVRARLEMILSLDPLSGLSEDDKMVRLSNRGITQQTYVISSNIMQFVDRAIKENTNFEKLPHAEKIKIITKFADQVIKETSAAAEVIPDDTE